MPNYTRREQVETFEARDEADGSINTITVYADVVYTETLDGTHNRNVGLKSLKMPNGNHVNVNSDGTLEDIHTRRKMRRI